MFTPFDENAERYDRWFESRNGQAVFEIETNCLREAMGTAAGRWLEVGVGTGRVAGSLDILLEGLDPSPRMLAIAERRGIQCVRGVAEDMPYPESSFDGVVMVTTLCFVDNPMRTLSECFRVLKTQGSLVVGIVPAESSWGKLYRAKGRAGHPMYSRGEFRTCERVILMCKNVGLFLKNVVSCLLSAPEAPPSPSLCYGIDENAGFVAMRFVKQTRNAPVRRRG